MKNNEITKWKKKYSRNKKKFLKNIESQVGIKIKKAHFVEDSIDFIVLKNGLESYSFKAFKYQKPDVIFSIVGGVNHAKLIVHNHITFYLPEGSLIRISPYDSKKLIITKIESTIKGVGIGSLMMEFLFTYIEIMLGYNPPILVELTGSLDNSYGKEGVVIPEKEFKFYLKFGFKIKETKDGIVLLERPEKFPEVDIDSLGEE